jgi:hypothetical protein
MVTECDSQDRTCEPINYVRADNLTSNSIIVRSKFECDIKIYRCSFEIYLVTSNYVKSPPSQTFGSPLRKYFSLLGKERFLADLGDLRGGLVNSSPGV